MAKLSALPQYLRSQFQQERTIDKKNQKKPKQPKQLKTMKKLIYILILAAVTSVSLSSCTEQEVKPANDGTGGGLGQDPKNG